MLLLLFGGIGSVDASPLIGEGTQKFSTSLQQVDDALLLDSSPYNTFRPSVPQGGQLGDRSYQNPDLTGIINTSPLRDRDQYTQYLQHMAPVIRALKRANALLNQPQHDVSLQELGTMVHSINDAWERSAPLVTPEEEALHSYQLFRFTHDQLSECLVFWQEAYRFRRLHQPYAATRASEDDAVIEKLLLARQTLAKLEQLLDTHEQLQRDLALPR